MLNIFRTFISLLWFPSRSEDMFCRLLLSVVLWSITTRGDLVTKVQDITYQNTDTALLPCDISNTNNPGDRVTLLLWYKEDRNQGGSPIYRIDARTNNNDISIGKKYVGTRYLSVRVFLDASLNMLKVLIVAKSCYKLCRSF